MNNMKSDAHIDVRKVQEHGSCNSCCRPNYESTLYQGWSDRFPMVDELYDIVISNVVIRLCPDCLHLMQQKVEAAMLEGKQEVASDG